MPRSATFRQRTGFHWPCVALASILADDICPEENGVSSLSLREEASEDGLTYFQIIRYLPHADLYLARVASNPAGLGESDLMAFFTDAQLTHALPWDVRLQQKGSGEIIAAIRAHAAALQPHHRSMSAVEADAITAMQGSSASTLHPLKTTIEITRNELCAAMQATVAEQQENTRHVGVSPAEAAHLVQQALLLAALDKLMVRLWQTPGQACSLIAQMKCKILALLRRWQQQTRQRVVNATARWCQVRKTVVWDLTIGVPVRGNVASTVV